MRMHHVSIFSSLHLDFSLHEDVMQDTGQCMLSEHSFGVKTSEWCTSFKNDVKQYALIPLLALPTSDVRLNFNQGHLHCLACIDVHLLHHWILILELKKHQLAVIYLRQYLSYGIQLRLTVDKHGIHTNVLFDDLDLYFDNVWKTHPSCYIMYSSIAALKSKELPGGSSVHMQNPLHFGQLNSVFNQKDINGWHSIWTYLPSASWRLMSPPSVSKYSTHSTFLQSATQHVTHVVNTWPVIHQTKTASP